jgi:hypothetical protein
MTRLDRDGGRFARVIASDLVEYFRTEGSPFAGSEKRARELASHGLTVLRARFGDDEALAHYYADCVGSAFESLALAAPALEALRTSPAPFVMRPIPDELVSIVFGPTKS